MLLLESSDVFFLYLIVYTHTYVSIDDWDECATYSRKIGTNKATKYALPEKNARWLLFFLDSNLIALDTILKSDLSLFLCPLPFRSYFVG